MEALAQTTVDQASFLIGETDAGMPVRELSDTVKIRVCKLVRMIAASQGRGLNVR